MSLGKLTSSQWTTAYVCNASIEFVSIEGIGHDDADDADSRSSSYLRAASNVDGVHKRVHNESSNVSIKIPLQSVMLALQIAFIATNDDFIGIHPESESSGSTATIAVLFDTHVVVAHVGDSRAMLCCDVDGRAFPLTLDHTPYLATEQSRIIENGGWIEDYGVLRVNGQLAVTRSIGDRRFRNVLISNPDVLVFRRHQSSPTTTTTTMMMNSSSSGMVSSMPEVESVDVSSVTVSPCEAYHMLYHRSHYNDSAATTAKSTHYYPPVQQFLVIASDGLWDVMTEQDVADFVCDHLGQYLSMPSYDSLLPIDAFHETAKLLAQAAYVRGSMDNIGVCLIDLY